MMSKIIHALNNSQNALLESPTGSGKSLALLCAALAWREHEQTKAAKCKEELLEAPSGKRIRTEAGPSDWAKKFRCDKLAFDDFQSDKFTKIADANTYETLLDNVQNSKENGNQFQKLPRIFVGSRTHKQLSQLVSELKRNTQYNPREYDEFITLSPDLIFFSLRHHGSWKSRSTVYLRTTHRVWDIEDMISLGKKVKGCPYYAARKLYESAAIVFCPYNYILNPVIRKLLDINLKDSIIILDEAHNMEDAARSAGSFELDDKLLSILKIELTQIIKGGFEPDAHRVLEHLFDGIWEWINSSTNKYDIEEYERHISIWSGQKIIDKLKGLNITAHVYETEFIPAYKTVSQHAESVRRESENIMIDDELEGSQLEVRVHRQECLSNNSLSIVQGIFLVFGFLFRKDRDYAQDYRMALMKRKEKGNELNVAHRKKNVKSIQDSLWSYKISFWCLNPGIIFQDMCAETKSVILTSGTLSPMETFASELETDFHGKLEANHVVDPSQVWVSCMPMGPNGAHLRGVYSNIESFRYQDDVGEAISQIAETVPFGILCFLPSYNALDKLMQRWTLTGTLEHIKRKKFVFLEPRGSDKKKFERVINAFYDQIDELVDYSDDEKDGAIFFAVYRGKVSEGVDFSDAYCRAVIALGLPYPGLKDIEVSLKKEYNDLKQRNQQHGGVMNGRDWYATQAYRAMNQALGRCIRHKNDWGAIILLEDRFQESEHIKGLSKWIRNRVHIHENFNEGISSLRDFVDHRLSIEQQSTIPNSDMPTDNQTITQQATVAFSAIKNENISDCCFTSCDCINTKEDIQPVEASITKSDFTVLDGDIREPDQENTAISLATQIERRLGLSPTISHVDFNQTKKIPQTSMTVQNQSTYDTLLDGLDAVFKDTDDDLDCEELENQASAFVPTIAETKPRKPMFCQNCRRILLTGDTSGLKHVNDFSLNCVLLLSINSTYVLEVEEPTAWEAYSVCIDLERLPNETQVYMNKADKLFYQKINCNCAYLIGVIVCGAMSPERQSYQL
ncbi:hypothetical protein G6F23_007418 [Rhizopus arrhizus]|nr:hypothetical protein G6F23_007418 [Rhizopus arrhizus]